mmetsp:Transcript_31034/g.78392  ORF Transcript_31034/g.78392 Transcript_31034/m.78392 type:complete len:236 (-) Transcript_31034:249-956(-)
MIAGCCGVSWHRAKAAMSPTHSLSRPISPPAACSPCSATLTLSGVGSPSAPITYISPSVAMPAPAAGLAMVLGAPVSTSAGTAGPPLTLTSMQSRPSGPNGRSGAVVRPDVSASHVTEPLGYRMTSPGRCSHRNSTASNALRNHRPMRPSPITSCGMAKAVKGAPRRSTPPACASPSACSYMFSSCPVAPNAEVVRPVRGACSRCAAAAVTMLADAAVSTIIVRSAPSKRSVMPM